MRKRYLLLVLLASLAGCGFISQNLEDGYQVGDITDGAVRDVAWYCSDDNWGLRALVRSIVRAWMVHPEGVCAVMPREPNGEQ